MLRGGDVRRSGSPAGAPSPRLTPGNAWGYPTNCKIPLSRSPFEHCVDSVVSYTDVGWAREMIGTFITSEGESLNNQ